MKNTQKGFIVPLLIAIIAVLAIGGGVYIFEQSKPQQSEQQPITNNQVSQTNTSSDNNQAPDPSKDSSITVLSPKANDVLVVGQTYNITWKSSNVGNQVVFINLLSDKNTLVSFLTQALPNNGSYSWKVGDSIPKGNYRVVVGTSENLPTGANVASGKSGLFSISSNVSAPKAPTITSVNPQTVYITGSTGMSDTLVTVTGTNFSEDTIHIINPATGANVTDLSANTPSGNPSSATQFQMKIPNFMTPGSYAVVVENSAFGLKSNSVPLVVALKSTQSNSSAQGSLYKTSFDGGTLYTSLYRSDDGGNTWTQIMRAYKSGIVYATYSQNSKIIYVADTSCNGMADTSRGCAFIYKSVDGGNNWTDISKGIMNQIGVIYGVSVINLDQNNSNNIKVTVSNQTSTAMIFQSTDGGNTWSKLSS